MNLLFSILEKAKVILQFLYDINETEERDDALAKLVLGSQAPIYKIKKVQRKHSFYEAKIGEQWKSKNKMHDFIIK